MSMTFAIVDAPSIPVFLIDSAQLPDWRADQPAHVCAWLETTGFAADLGQVCLVPDATGAALLVAVGFGTETARRRGRFHLAKAAAALPAGTYHIATTLETETLEEAALGWLLSGYQFNRYRAQKPAKAKLVAPSGIDAKRIEAIAAGEVLTRDLINTPASDMGPEELENAFLALAANHGAQAQVIVGDDLLAQNLPMIHAVGRASTRAPRLLDMRWGDAGPTLTLVGKGVCFDTGGLNIKPGASMGLMKKDMGGAASVLALASMIMTAGLNLRLRVLIPAADNNVSSNAFRPGDVLASRNGMSVEIGNTDAEGRLVLADALALGDEEKPDYLLTMATLTGAARVALGPDLPPFYSTDDDFADAVLGSGVKIDDPLWRMPFWAPYDDLLK
ncbi:MAG: leucyl aminopeptidase family protein, partial [Marinosulfonomonas sp.]|nr:leucyl aminopeptidase family protein [Marinosulfonomonas sp.]